METWRDLGSRLERHIRPATFPIALRVLKPGEEVPEGARRPRDAVGCPIALCQGLTLTRQRGMTLLLEREESSCPYANSSLGWGNSDDTPLMRAFFRAMNYARDDAAAAKRDEGMARLTAGSCAGVVLSPLTRTRIEPHVVMVYGNPAQIMRLVHACTHWTGERVPADFGGLAGSCNEGFVRTYASGDPRVALPGNGDRVFATAHDDELIFAFPAVWGDRVLEGLEATSARGVRYPIPTFMEYRLPFGDLMQKFSP